MKRHSNVSERQTRYFSDWLLSVSSNPAVTCFRRNIPPCPSPQQSSSSLNKVCISSSYTCSGTDYKLPCAASWFACVLGSVGAGLTRTWVPILTLQLAGSVASGSYLTFLSLSFLICQMRTIMLPHHKTVKMT